MNRRRLLYAILVIALVAVPSGYALNLTVTLKQYQTIGGVMITTTGAFTVSNVMLSFWQLSNAQASTIPCAWSNYAECYAPLTTGDWIVQVYLTLNTVPGQTTNYEVSLNGYYLYFAVPNTAHVGDVMGFAYDIGATIGTPLALQIFVS